MVAEFDREVVTENLDFLDQVVGTVQEDLPALGNQISRVLEVFNNVLEAIQIGKTVIYCDVGIQPPCLLVQGDFLRGIEIPVDISQVMVRAVPALARTAPMMYVLFAMRMT